MAGKAHAPCLPLKNLYLIYITSGGKLYPVVEETANPEKENARSTDGKGELGVGVALESRQGRIGVLDVHSLDDEQIIVKAHYGIYQGDEHYKVSKR